MPVNDKKIAGLHTAVATIVLRARNPIGRIVFVTPVRGSARNIRGRDIGRGKTKKDDDLWKKFADHEFITVAAAATIV